MELIRTYSEPMSVAGSMLCRVGCVSTLVKLCDEGTAKGKRNAAAALEGRNRDGFLRNIRLCG